MSEMTLWINEVLLVENPFTLLNQFTVYQILRNENGSRKEFLHAAEPEVKGSWSLPSQRVQHQGSQGLGERRVREGRRQRQ